MAENSGGPCNFGIVYGNYTADSSGVVFPFSAVDIKLGLHHIPGRAGLGPRSAYFGCMAFDSIQGLYYGIGSLHGLPEGE